MRLLLIVVLSFVLFPDEAWACTCAPSTPKQVFEKVDAVFSAVVTALEYPAGKDLDIEDIKGQVTLKVLKVWKGRPGRTVVMLTQKFGSCDVWGFAKRDSTFLVYAYYAKYYTKTSRILTTNWCLRTAGIRSAVAAGDLESLGPGKNP